MKADSRNDMTLASRLGALLAGSLLLAACGGGSSGGDDGGGPIAGIGGTGIVAGPITGFGSVWVNGREIEIDPVETEIEVDGTGGKSQDDLRLGMIVTLEVKTENGVFINEATRVIYDDEIEGPLANLQTPDPTTKTAEVFGQTVTFSDTTTVYEGTDFDSLLNDDVLEISGFRSDTGITATYVRSEGSLTPGTTEGEIRGTIQNLTGVTPNESFEIGTTTINTNGLVLGFSLADGMFVEVKGVIEADSSITATRIEQEDENFDDEVDDISVQGIVSGFATGGISDFKVGSQRVNASGVSAVPALADGLKIEVEGEIVGGVLFANEVELRDEDSKLRSFIGNVDLASGTFQVNYIAAVGTVNVHVDGNTLFEDDTGGTLVSAPFSLDDLNANIDFVRVEGIEFDDPATVGDDVRASYVRRVIPDSPAELEVEGLVDDYAKSSFITVLGVTYDISDSGLQATVFDPLGLEDSIVKGLTFVEVEDEEVGGINPPGTADKIKLED